MLKNPQLIEVARRNTVSETITHRMYAVDADRKRHLLLHMLNDKPDMEVIVKGHTDNVPISRECFKDNWDLSASRATTIARVLQTDFKVDPARITAGGRSEYVPLVANDTPENRSINRRIRIVILPKLDQFYNMIEDGLKQAGEMK